MTKKEIIGVLADKMGITKKDATEAVGIVFDTIAESLASEENVSITGFGKFEYRKTEDRECRNPQTGGTILVPAHGVVKFKPSKTLKDTVK